MMQDPMIMGQIGQSPMAQQMQGAIMAHVAEHLAFQYRQKVQEQLGATLPAPDAQLDNNVEVQVSKLVAQAAQQLLQMDKAKAAQQQAMQQAQDPIIQMQQAELQIKKQEADIKALKVKGDLQLKAEELSLKAQESAARTGEDPQMAAMRLQQEIAQAQELHALEMAAKQMELQQAQAQQQQAMQQQQAQVQQKMAQGGQVHEQKMKHADLDRIQRLLQGNRE
jgi:predicted membrane-bound mannosyltransferase